MTDGGLQWESGRGEANRRFFSGFGRLQWSHLPAPRSYPRSKLCSANRRLLHQHASSTTVSWTSCGLRGWQHHPRHRGPVRASGDASRAPLMRVHGGTRKQAGLVSAIMTRTSGSRLLCYARKTSSSAACLSHTYITFHACAECQDCLGPAAAEPTSPYSPSQSNPLQPLLVVLRYLCPCRHYGLLLHSPSCI